MLLNHFYICSCFSGTRTPPPPLFNTIMAGIVLSVHMLINPLQRRPPLTNLECLRSGWCRRYSRTQITEADTKAEVETEIKGNWEGEKAAESATPGTTGRCPWEIPEPSVSDLPPPPPEGHLIIGQQQLTLLPA